MIGIFDSGHGGLTVLRALVAALPERSFLYLGDHRNAPYGTRAPAEIDALTRRAVETLFGLGCRLVVLACNTAAATSLRRLQQDWLPHRYPGRRVLGVLVPMVEAITGVPWMEDAATRAAGTPRVVAVFATPRTVESGAYPVEIHKRAPELRVVQQACPDLAGLIERDASRAILRAAIARDVAALMATLDGRPPDTVVLGCTHYPLVADLFEEALPRGVALLRQPELAATSLAAYLARHPEFDQIDRAAEPVRFYTTGDAALVSRLATAFFGGLARFAAIEHAAAAP